MSARMTKIYTAVKHVLDAAIPVATVPHVNIRPADDASEAQAGNMIYYGWAAGRWDSKSSRGSGTLNVSVAAVDDKVDAGAILDQVRDALTARALSYTGSPIRVHLFRETDSLGDAGTTDSGRSLAATSFDVKFVEA